VGDVQVFLVGVGGEQGSPVVVMEDTRGERGELVGEDRGEEG